MQRDEVDIMTKKNCRFYLILFLIFLSLILLCCYYIVKYNRNKIMEIKQDYVDYLSIEKNISDVVIDYYIGEYNEYIILMLSYEGQPFFDWIITCYFDDMELVYPNSNILIAWKNGVFYQLKDLYESQELSTKDVKKIIKKYYKARENEICNSD